MSEPISYWGILILVLVGIWVSYYCKRNQFMISQSLVFINFGIFATWWILFLLKPNMALDAFVSLGFKSAYLESPNIRLLTLVSSMFMHAGPMHLLLNMLILIFLGVPFEDRIGSRSFLRIYVISGILGSLITGYISVWNQSGLETINLGASGAVFGIMGGFALLYPRDEIPMLLGPIFMHRVPVLLATLVFVAMETFYIGMGTEDGIGHTTHMASFAIGVFVAPYYSSKNNSVEIKLDLDIDKFRKISNITKKGYYELEMMQTADEPELLDAWIETFWEVQECPDCKSTLSQMGQCSECDIDYLN
jgi:membrane associated rhomboid family serine protease